MTTDIKNILEALNRISNLEDDVRDFINTGRYQVELLKSRDTWNQICSSLDVIGDTIFCIQAYMSSPYPSSDGLKYIYTYGCLQALFIQQDAVRHLSEAFGIPHDQSLTLAKIRDIRNAAIGHPTKQQIRKTTLYNYISRISLEKEGFTLLRSSSEDDKPHFLDVNMNVLVQEQLCDIELILSSLSKKLKEADQLHRQKFGGKLITDIFHSSTGYLFSKVSEGIHSSSNSSQSFGLSMLDSVQEMYLAFESALEERRELDEYTRYDLDEYKHAIAVLKDFLSGNPKQLSKSDACIYLFYLREQHNHFVSFAKEIDEDYSGNTPN